MNAAAETSRNGHRVNGSAAPPRTMPHNLDLEAAVLGGVMLRNEVLAELATLEVVDFFDLRHRAVFAAIRELQVAGRPIDFSTLAAEIERAGKLEAIGGIGYIGELQLRVPTIDNVVEYARDLQLLARNRAVQVALARSLEEAQRWTGAPEDLLDETVGELQRIGTGYRDAQALPIITIGDAMNELKRLAATPVYETPFPELNRTLGFDGLLAGQVYYLAGGTGFGKTSWLASVVRAHATQGRPAIVAFWEMFAGYYVARMTAGVLGVQANSIIRGRVDERSVIRAMPQTIEFLDSPSMNILRRAVDRRTKLSGQPPLVVIDYVQLLGDQIMSTMARPDARLANSQASAGLRAIAKSTGAAVICVSAAGRSSSKKLTGDIRKSPARDLVDASRESGAIEFDGAGVIVLSVSEELDGDEMVATMSVAKARFGSTLHIDARYDGRTGHWREVGIAAKIHSIFTPPNTGAVREAIERVLKRGPVKSKTKIHALSGKNKAAILSELDVMVDQGSVVITDAGFELATTPSPQAEQQSIAGIS